MSKHIELAVSILCEELRKDRDLWYAYQSAIAMSAYDALAAEGITGPIIHKAVNIAANNFLELLTKEQHDTETEPGTEMEPQEGSHTVGSDRIGVGTSYPPQSHPTTVDEAPPRLPGGDGEPFRDQIDPISYIHEHLDTYEAQMLWSALIKLTTEVYRDKTPYQVLDILQETWQRCKPNTK